MTDLDAGSEIIPEPTSLARTYSHPSYDDPWEAVLDHRRVLEYAAEHPNRGSQAIASALDLPRGRIRPWLETASMPDAARAVQVADVNGWLVRELDSDAANGLAGLVAWIFAGGSINQRNYVPYWALRRASDTSLDRLQTIASWYAVRLRRSDRDDTDDQARAIEYRAAEHASILGRCLHVAGAPIGPKTETDLSIPAWLDDAPAPPRQTFAAVYIAERATKSKPYRYRLAEQERDAAWLHELGAFLVDVAGTGECWISDPNVVFDKAATDALDTIVRSGVLRRD